MEAQASKVTVVTDLDTDEEIMYIPIPSSIIKEMNLKEGEVVDVEYTESWFDDGEFDGLVVTFRERKLNV